MDCVSEDKEDLRMSILKLRGTPPETKDVCSLMVEFFANKIKIRDCTDAKF